MHLSNNNNKKLSMMQVYAISIVCCCAWVSLVQAGVPMPRYEALMRQQSQPELGLYNASDKVNIISQTNFKELVLEQNRSSLVEFYNSYCGHCKRFAPYYKELAEQLLPWSDVLLVGAIDCAAEENNDICREYEVMAYPTLRYMGPGFVPKEKSYGRHIDSQDLSFIRSTLAQWMAAENRTANMISWPNLQPLSESEASKSLFEGLDSRRQYVVLVYDDGNSSTGIETVLNYTRWPGVQVRRVVDSELTAKYKIDGVHNKLATINRAGNVLSHDVDGLQTFLKQEHITERPVVNLPPVAHDAIPPEVLEDNKETLNEVKRNKHFVYQADLELALRGIIFNEIPKASEIHGERLQAVQRFFAVLRRYNPLGANGRTLVNKLYDFVMQFSQEMTGKQFEDELTRLEAQLDPIFSAKHFVGCAASRQGLRGFTCSLWQLFHFMTVQAARSEDSQDPLEVLQAMHGYVKHYFGCTDCAAHFQEMATQRKIWDVPNKDEAVLWLWAAHNQVNKRLAGDSTEDPKFPKIQFPSESSCTQCYKRGVQSRENLDIEWNKDEVLSFLKNIHNPEYVSRYGLEREDLLYPTAEKLRQKRMIGNVFSDMDMRMGMLLYGFCIIMMVVAFKLFAFKGYRKKPYGHDMLGKV